MCRKAAPFFIEGVFKMVLSSLLLALTVFWTVQRCRYGRKRVYRITSTSMATWPYRVSAHVWWAPFWWEVGTYITFADAARKVEHLLKDPVYYREAGVTGTGRAQIPLRRGART